MIKSSSLEWIILRFCAVLPINVETDPQMFDVPLSDRIEFAHTRDVGLACANAVVCKDAIGKILLIGGGSRCQMHYRDMVRKALECFGLGMLPEKAFTTEPFCQDWVDSTESQRLLQFQRLTYDDWIEDTKAVLGFKRHLARIFRPLARWYLLRQSPYYRAD
jgi:hypothetical protein